MSDAITGALACGLDGLTGAGFSVLDVAFVLLVIGGGIFAIVKGRYTWLVVLVVIALLGGALLLGH